MPSDSIGKDAAHWVARMDAGGWTDLDERELTAWLDSDPANRGLLLKTHAQWLAADHALSRPETEESDGGQPVTQPGTQPWLNRRTLVSGAAAVVAASLAGVLVWPGKGRSYATDLGEIRRVPLQDGSVAAINTSSEISVHFDRALRKIELARGEAWFDVAKDASRPFLVKAGRARIRAVGTAFSVRIGQEGVEVLITEGTVAAWSQGEEGASKLLHAGQRGLLIPGAGFRMADAETPSVDRVLAWRDGKIDLSDMSVADAVEQFNRYNRRKLVIDDPLISGERFDGTFGVNDPEGFANALRTSLSARVDTSSPHEIRISRGSASVY